MVMFVVRLWAVSSHEGESDEAATADLRVALGEDEDGPAAAAAISASHTGQIPESILASVPRRELRDLTEDDEDDDSDADDIEVPGAGDADG